MLQWTQSFLRRNSFFLLFFNANGSKYTRAKYQVLWAFVWLRRLFIFFLLGNTVLLSLQTTFGKASKPKKSNHLQDRCLMLHVWLRENSHTSKISHDQGLGIIIVIRIIIIHIKIPAQHHICWCLFLLVLCDEREIIKNSICVCLCPLGSLKFNTFFSPSTNWEPDFFFLLDHNQSEKKTFTFSIYKIGHFWG